MRILLTLCARGGSKGFKNKNLHPLLGKSLIARAVGLARSWGRAERVVCSTDSPEIAEAARAAGAETPFVRPAELATDGAGKVPVIRHALKECERIFGGTFDAVVDIDPTSPVRSTADLQAAWEAFETRRPQVLFTVTPARKNPYFNMVERRPDGSYAICKELPGAVLSRQQAPAVYEINSSIYVYDRVTLADDAFVSVTAVKFDVHVMDEESAFDVDRELDLEIDEAILRRKARKAAGEGAGRVFIIAEAGVNHNGSLDLARRLVDAAAEAGADAVKFQSFRAESLLTKDAPKAAYQVEATGTSESQYEMLRKLELSDDDHRALMRHCRERAIEFLSTPFDEERADFLEKLGVRLFKIPSGEITNALLLRHVASKGKPVILSTGMSTLEEVEAAVGLLRREGAPSVTVLHCVSAYPAPAEQTNLRAMDTLRDALGCPVGLSDHSLGIGVALAAVARGASVVEKHFTLDRSLPGPDHQASLLPAELKAMVQGIREVEAALGDGVKKPAAGEENTRQVARRSLVAARDLPAGAKLAPGDLRAKRPAGGISPMEIGRLVGRRLRAPLRQDGRLSWEMVE